MRRLLGVYIRFASYGLVLEPVVLTAVLLTWHVVDPHKLAGYQKRGFKLVPTR